MSDHYAWQERNAGLYGWRLSSAARCPLVVVGKRCRLSSGERCVCSEHHHALDHGRMWLDRDGRRVLTGEPYDISGRELCDFIEAMEGLGLRVWVSGRSLWHEHTMLLIVSTS